MGILLLIGLLMLGLSHGAPGAFSAMGIALGVTFAVSLLFPLKDVVLLRIRRGQSSSEAYISPASIILGGWYTPLIGLERINYQAGEPAVPGFVTRHSDGRGGTSTRTIEVPVPRGRESEAEQLVSDFKGKIAIR
jgi:hypothetical protein